jgi:hypothetical protein
MLRRIAFLGLTVATLAACSDVTPPSTAPTLPSASVMAGPEMMESRFPGGGSGAQCPNLTPAQLQALIRQIFANGQPNVNAALARFAVILGNVARNNPRAAQRAMWELAEFIYRKKSGTAPRVALARLINGLLCLVGLVPTVPENSDSFFILPTDEQQVIKRADNRAGVILPAGPVGAPAILTIDYSDTIRLVTKFDQYGGGARFTLSTPLVGTATIAVCPGFVPLDPALRARLRLGHGASSGFEIIPSADPSPVGLNCPDLAVASASPLERAVATVASAILPKALHARVFNAAAADFAGGVGGSASEFSPFAPIDPELFAAGGVGGSASEFLRAGPGFLSYTAADCPVVEGAIGSPLSNACRPQVTVATRNGTPFIGVPITFAVQTGGGAMAAEGAGESCGAFGPAASTTTNTQGVSRACWTLGATPGSNSTAASPGIGGDAVTGATFSPSVLVFNAIGNPPAQFGLGAMPSSMTAGSPMPFVVEVQDYRGNRVHIAGGQASVYNSRENTLTLTEAQSAGSFAAMRTTSVRAMGFVDLAPRKVPVINGRVALDSLTVVGASGTYELRIEGQGFPALSLPTFTVTPGAPNQMGAIWAPASRPAGSTTQVQVGVRDAWNNIVTGAQVSWTPETGSAGTVPVTTATDLNGLSTSGAWNIGLGANTLRATVVGRPSLTVLFSVPGTP